MYHYLGATVTGVARRPKVVQRLTLQHRTSPIVQDHGDVAPKVVHEVSFGNAAPDEGLGALRRQAILWGQRRTQSLETISMRNSRCSHTLLLENMPL